MAGEGIFEEEGMQKQKPKHPLEGTAFVFYAFHISSKTNSLSWKRLLFYRKKYGRND